MVDTGSYSTIWSLPPTNVKWHSDPRPVTVTSPTNQTFHQFHDLDTEFDLHRITSGFHKAFATGVVCHQGTLTLPDTWFRPTFWDFFMLQLLRPVFPNLPCHFPTFHRRYPSALPRFCFCFLLFYQVFIQGANLGVSNPEILYFAPISLGIKAYRFLRLFKTTPTDRVKSVRNRCEIEFLWRFCVVTLLFGFFCGCRCF